MNYRSEKTGSFVNICSQVLKPMNYFSCNTKKRRFRTEKQAAFSKGDCSKKKFWVFTDLDLIETVKLASYKIMDLNSPCIKKIVNTMCESSKTVPATAVLGDNRDLRFCSQTSFFARKE